MEKNGQLRLPYHTVPLDSLDQLEKKESEDQLARLGPLDLRDLLDLQVIRDPQVPQEVKARGVQWGLQANAAPLDQLDPRAQRDLRGQLAQLDPPVL